MDYIKQGAALRIASSVISSRMPCAVLASDALGG